MSTGVAVPVVALLCWCFLMLGALIGVAAVTSQERWRRRQVRLEEAARRARHRAGPRRRAS